jgi:hypothetical protein
MIVAFLSFVGWVELPRLLGGFWVCDIRVARHSTLALVCERISFLFVEMCHFVTMVF